MLSIAKEQMEYGFQFCDILKISDNEIQFVSGKEDCDAGMDHLTETQLLEILRFANTAAAIVTTRKGAIRAMPEKEEVEKLMKSSF